VLRRVFSWTTLQGVVFVALAGLSLCLYVLPAIRQYRIAWLLVFDYGILFNSTQELAFGRPAFLTTRGVHVWADSQDYFQYLFAWLHHLPHPHYALIVAHSLAIWFCGVFCFFYLRAERRVSLLVAATAWLSPHLVNSSNDLFHTESYATILHLLLFLGAVRGRPGLFWSATLLVLTCKEDIAIYVAWFMVLAWFRPDRFPIGRRQLAAAFVVAVAVFAVNQAVVQPYYKVLTCEWLGAPVQPKDVQATPSPWFPDIWRALLRPDYWTRVLTADVARYLAMLFWPVLFFPRAAFPMTLLPLAGATVNVLGSGYLIKTEWHYDHSTYAAVIIAMLLGLSRIRRKDLVAILIFAVALGIHLYWPHMRARVTQVWNGQGDWWAFPKDDRVTFYERLTTLLPADVVISSDYHTVSYLLPGQSQVFMFENPFRPDHFGVYGLCDGGGKPLPGLPPADLVVLQDEYRPRASGQAVLASMLRYRVTRAGGRWTSFYLNPDSPRRAELEILLDGVGAQHFEGPLPPPDVPPA
jgi:hypothetical protein